MIARKVALREAIKARRAEIPAEVRAARSRRVAETGLGALAPPPGTAISGFLSIGDELDTGPLLGSLAAAGYRLCLPVMAGKGKPLVFRAWTPGDPMRERMWGIREPLPEAPEVVPRLLLVPLLAFDGAGYRLGYGGGFYDRTLAALRRAGSVTAIGLAFDEQEVDAVPRLAYDERLDWILTPSGARAIER